MVRVGVTGPPACGCDMAAQHEEGEQARWRAHATSSTPRTESPSHSRPRFCGEKDKQRAPLLGGLPRLGALTWDSASRRHLQAKAVSAVTRLCRRGSFCLRAFAAWGINRHNMCIHQTITSSSVSSFEPKSRPHLMWLPIKQLLPSPRSCPPCPSVAVVFFVHHGNSCRCLREQERC